MSSSASSETSETPINSFVFYLNEYQFTYDFNYETKTVDKKTVNFLKIVEKNSNKVIETHEGDSKKKAREVFLKNTTLPMPKKLIETVLGLDPINDFGSSTPSMAIDPSTSGLNDESSEYEPPFKRPTHWSPLKEGLGVKPEPKLNSGAKFSKYFNAYREHLIFKNFYQKMKEKEKFRFIILVNERNQDDLFEVHSQEGEDLKLIKDQCYELFLRNTKLAHPDTLPSKKVEREIVIKQNIEKNRPSTGFKMDAAWEFYLDIKRKTKRSECEWTVDNCTEFSFSGRGKMRKLEVLANWDKKTGRTGFPDDYYEPTFQEIENFFPNGKEAIKEAIEKQSKKKKLEILEYLKKKNLSFD